MLGEACQGRSLAALGRSRGNGGFARAAFGGHAPENGIPETISMAYVIAEPCIGVKDTACVDACPVDCIHPRKDEPGFADAELLYIDP
jgi:hypothetical protein